MELSPTDLRGQWLAIAILCAPLILGALMTADEDKATLLGVEGPQCPSLLIWPHGCPGCGLTRSVSLTMHGSLVRAFGVNPAGIVVVLFAVMGLMVRGDILWRGRINSVHWSLLRRGRQIFVFALLLSWVGRVLTSGES